VDRLEISGLDQLGPAKCGERYRHWLRRNGLKHPWTVVALPRALVLWRHLQFPGSVSKELRRAVELQLDTLHPFEEGGVWWDFAVQERSKRRGFAWPGAAAEPSGPLEVHVAIAEREAVERWAGWFHEANIPVSQFTVTTALLLGMLEARRSTTAAVNAPAFCLHGDESGCELVGLTPGGASVSREARWEPGMGAEQAAVLVQRELQLARSELRMNPTEAAIVCTGGQLPGEAALEGDGTVHLTPLRDLFAPFAMDLEPADLRENVAGVAAAVAAAVDRSGPFTLNLLPAERRSYESPLVYVPTYALAGLVVVLAVALGLRAPVQEWLYGRSLERDRQALLPQIQQLEQRQEQDRRVYEQLATLARLRLSSAVPLELLDELTRRVPSDAWLQGVQYDGNSVSLTGSAASATAVLQALADSDRLESPQFLSAVTRSNDGKESFRIGARLRASSR
jgi:Tfp pilus assembly protein PilN